MSKKSDKTNVPMEAKTELQLLDTPRTWFQFNGSDHNVKAAPADVFDAWIRQYVDTIVNVDTEHWEIFQRWNIINAVIDGQFLELKQWPDGSQKLEEKSSDATSESEEKIAEVNVGELALEAMWKGK